MILGAVEGDQDVTFESWAFKTWAFKTWAFEAAHGVEKRSKPFHASVESDPRRRRNSHHSRKSIRRTQQARKAKTRTAGLTGRACLMG
jgi:hypothetical protein